MLLSFTNSSSGMMTVPCKITLYPCVRSVSLLSPLNGAPLSSPHFILVLPWAEIFEPADVHYLSFDVPKHWNWDSGTGFECLTQQVASCRLIPLLSLVFLGLVADFPEARMHVDMVPMH